MKTKSILIIALLFLVGMLSACASTAPEQPQVHNDQPQVQEAPQVEEPSVQEIVIETPGEENAVGPKTIEIKIRNFKFEPETAAYMNVGDTIIWTNEDTAPHSIISDSNAAAKIQSPILKKGESYSYTIQK